MCFDPSKKYSDIERWSTIFPAYLNKKKTVAEGRNTKRKGRGEPQHHRNCRSHESQRISGRCRKQNVRSRSESRPVSQRKSPFPNEERRWNAAQQRISK